MPNKSQPTIPLAQPNNELKIYPGAIPTTPILWPAVQHPSNQIQQTKGSAKPQATGVLPTTQPNQSTVAPRTTPAHVSNVRVVSRNVGGQKNITVQFNHPSGDPYFSGANVYLRSGTKQPVLVASGAKSPLTFTATNDSAPHSVHVTSVGNWGETDVMTSPSAPVKLFGPLNASKATGTALGTGGGSPTPPPSSGGDGLIHGDSIWVIDDAYSTWRDDFRFINNSGAITGGITISQIPWAISVATSALAISYNPGPPCIGALLFGNGASATLGCFVVPENSASPASDSNSADALFEHPNWKMVWNFGLLRPVTGASATSTPFDFSETSLYIGLAMTPSLSTYSNAVVPRPICGTFLRYDTDTTSPSIGDTEFVFESVCQSAHMNSNARFNAQGNTAATGIVPTEGHFYRLEIECIAVGQVMMTLTDSVQSAGTGASVAVAQFSATLNVATFTGGNLEYEAGDGMAYILPAGTTNTPFAAGSIVQIANTGAAGIDGQQILVVTTGGGTALNFYSGQTYSLTHVSLATVTGYPAVYPYFVFGNDTNGSPPSANVKGVFLDLVDFVWNPGVGGGTGTPNPLFARYF